MNPSANISGRAKQKDNKLMTFYCLLPIPVNPKITSSHLTLIWTWQIKICELVYPTCRACLALIQMRLDGALDQQAVSLSLRLCSRAQRIVTSHHDLSNVVSWHTMMHILLFGSSSSSSMSSLCTNAYLIFPRPSNATALRFCALAASLFFDISRMLIR